MNCPTGTVLTPEPNIPFCIKLENAHTAPYDRLRYGHIISTTLPRLSPAHPPRTLRVQ